MDINENEIVRRYLGGESRFQMSKDLGCSDFKILRALERNNVEIRGLSESHRVFGFDEKFFEVINSEANSYFLGFMMADGNVHKNIMQICLHEKDVGILEKFKEELSSEHTIVSDRLKYRRFRINSEKLVSDLTKHGCVPNKTLILNFPDSVPDVLMHHFMRGYFDGDGCIHSHVSKKHNPRRVYTWKFDVMSTKGFLEKYLFCLRTMAGIPYEVNVKMDSRGRNVYSFRYSSTTPINLRRIYEFLYRDATIFLDRKKDRFEFLLNTYT